jgi:hypothetical protein
MMQPDEELDEAGRCLVQALALLDATQQLRDELLSVASAAMSGAADEAGRTDVRR